MTLALNTLQFATQSNLKTGDVTDEYFKVPGTIPPVRGGYDLKVIVKDGAKTRFVMATKFLADQPEDMGWTTAKAGNDVYLLRTPKDHADPLLRAKFLKTPKSPEFGSDLLAYLLKDQLVDGTNVFQLLPVNLEGADFLTFQIVAKASEITSSVEPALIPVTQPPIVIELAAVVEESAKVADMIMTDSVQDVAPALADAAPLPTQEMELNATGFVENHEVDLVSEEANTYPTEVVVPQEEDVF